MCNIYIHAREKQTEAHFAIENSIDIMGSDDYSSDTHASSQYCRQTPAGILEELVKSS